MPTRLRAKIKRGAQGVWTRHACLVNCGRRDHLCPMPCHGLAAIATSFCLPRSTAACYRVDVFTSSGCIAMRGALRILAPIVRAMFCASSSRCSYSHVIDLPDPTSRRFRFSDPAPVVRLR